MEKQVYSNTPSLSGLATVGRDASFLFAELGQSDGKRTAVRWLDCRRPDGRIADGHANRCVFEGNEKNNDVSVHKSYVTVE